MTVESIYALKPKPPVTVITGFLGSGKTTLLRKMLADTDRRLAILMNEFGEIAIDSKVVAGKNVEIAELGGGCVCCSLIGEFEAAIKEIIETVRPDLIVVETTGVAEPDAIIFEIKDGLPEVRLDGVIAIADAYAMVKFPQLGRTTKMQLEAADVILINKTDLVSGEELKQVETRLRQLNERAVLFKTAYCHIDTRLLLGLDVEKEAAPVEHVHEMEFDSFSFSTDRRLHKERFEQAIEMLPQQVYRAKGFVRCDGGSYLFNYVAGRWDLEEYEAEKTELVFIGKGLAGIKDQVIAQLQACEVRDGI
jgi:G3E family GTPase